MLYIHVSYFIYIIHINHMSTKTNTKATKEANLDTFVDAMIQGAGLHTLPDDYLDQYKEQLLIQVERRIGLIILSELNDEDAEHYMKKFAEDDSADPMHVQDFLTTRIENFEEKLRLGLDALVEEFIKAAQTA